MGIEFRSYPLVVDLNGTLSSSDNLLEAVLFILLRRPQASFELLAALMRGKSALKQYIATIGAYQTENLPLRAEFVDFLNAERAAGRQLYLVTGADQSVADAINQRLGLFEKVIGSSDGFNLNSRAKRIRIEGLLPDGYAYAGGERSDLEVWRTAKSIVIVGAHQKVAREARAFGLPVEQEFLRGRTDWRTWIRALRIHQWAKNILIFVPLFLAGKFYDPASVMKATLGFLTFGAIASATYLVNDLSDLGSDRNHSTKKNRPIANGEITIISGLTAACVLGITGLGGAFLIDAKFGLTALLYIVLTVSYSVRLKAIALLDVFVLASLYTVRILLGSVLLSNELSHWLLMFSLFFFYSLSVAKRYAEINRAVAAGLNGKIRGRGYRTIDGPFTLSVGLASAVAAVVVLLQYVANDAAPVKMYHSPEWLWPISFLVFMWSTRIWLKSHHGQLDDDPVIFALKDPPSWLLGLSVALCFILALL